MRTAAGANSRRKNGLGRYARVFQLAANDGFKIQKGFVAVSPRDRVMKTRGLERRDDVQPDLETAWPDARADTRDKSGRHGPELRLHPLYGSGDDVLYRTPPSGVNGGHGAMDLIMKQYGSAVCGAHGKKCGRLIGQEGIPGSRVQASSPNDADVGSVELVVQLKHGQLFEIRQV